MEERKPRIMIVEDDRFVMDIYHTKLTMEGFDVIDAVNGQECLDKLRAEKELPDMVLLDIVMPVLGGLEALVELREEERFKKLPVILLTNLNQKAETDKGIELGATDFLIKSHLTPSEVFAKIKGFLEKEKEKKNEDR